MELLMENMGETALMYILFGHNSMMTDSDIGPFGTEKFDFLIHLLEVSKR